MKKLSFWVLGIFLTVTIGSFALCGYLWRTATLYTIAGVPVLNYHQVNNLHHSALTMKEAHFEQQMKYLSNNGYTSIRLDQLYDYLSENKPLPEKPVLITFDDGYIDNYTKAFPILKKYKMKATLFMITDSIGASGFVTANQLKEMQAGGIDIESHTVSHRPVFTLKDSELRLELHRSRKDLETLLGRPVRYIAYPGGFTNEKTATIAKEEGYRMGFTVETGFVKSSSNLDLYALPRLPIFEGDSSFLSLKMRLHLPDLIVFMWRTREHLITLGYPSLAHMIPQL